MNSSMESFLLALWVIVGITQAAVIPGSHLTMDEVIAQAGNINGSLEVLNDGRQVLVELDMIFKTEDYLKYVLDEDSDDKEGTRVKRKALGPLVTRWTDGVVPYEVSSDFSSTDRATLMDAIADYDKYTCIKFHKANSGDRNRVRFQNGPGCSSNLGMIGGPQPINLKRNDWQGLGCRHKGVIVHEIGHALGLIHEQGRPDRDNYITINWHNVIPDTRYNFHKWSSRDINIYGVRYDYASIMHYGQRAFTSNGGITIQAKDPKYQSIMGNRVGMSFNDIKIINKMYDCAENERCPQRSCPQGGFQGKDCQCWCNGGDLNKPIVPCN